MYKYSQPSIDTNIFLWIYNVLEGVYYFRISSVKSACLDYVECSQIGDKGSVLMKWFDDLFNTNMTFFTCDFQA